MNVGELIDVPPATWGYLLAYWLGLVVHVLFMNYVLAGSAYLTCVTVFTGGASVQRHRTALALVLRDWLPFALSAAITAGVAPLLFVQILYQEMFYTANLLLVSRWAVVLPALIAGFYLLYIMKSRRIGSWRAPIRALVGVGAFACFVWTGCAWTQNHLVSLDRAHWPIYYLSGVPAGQYARLGSRFGIWLFGSVPTMCWISAWQLWLLQKGGTLIPASEARRIARLALFGLAAAVLCSAGHYVLVGHAAAKNAVFSATWPFLTAAAAGLVVQVASWLLLAWRGELQSRVLSLAGFGLLATILGTVAVREFMRISVCDLELLVQRHVEMARVGGLPLFIVFLVLNSAAIAWCFRLVRRGRVTESAGSSRSATSREGQAPAEPEAPATGPTNRRSPAA